jgi:chaperonin GroEL
MLVKETAQRTNDTAGDGRKTTVLLTQAIATEGMKIISAPWYKRLFKPRVNAIGIKSGIDKASKIAVDYLKSISTPISGDADAARVAVISAKSEEIGKFIADTISKLGVDSVITVEESSVMGMTSEISQGLEFDKGFISPYMATDTVKLETVLVDAGILVTDMKIGAIEPIMPLINAFMETGKRDLLIIAEDVIGEALQAFILNKLRGTANIVCVKAPGFGIRKRDYLEDIATLTGATLLSNELISIEDAKLESLGSASRIVVKKDRTTIVGGNGDKVKIDARIAQAKLDVEATDSKHDKLKIEERIAKLSGGVAIIKIGAATETETKYLKLKIEDSINAVRAASEEGIVQGGGTALVRASQAVLDAKNRDIYTNDELHGFDILAKALLVPLSCIATNCGFGDGSSVVKTVQGMATGGGFDALNNTFVNNMVDSGIIDPLKVERCAIENAVSEGSMFLTTEIVMAEIPKENV